MSTGGTRPEKRCTYANCDRPEHGSDFHQIEAGRRSGGQDWSSLAGFTLCNACYQQYKRRGTLERSRNKPIQAGKRRSESPLLPPFFPPAASPAAQHRIEPVFPPSFSRAGVVGDSPPRAVGKANPVRTIAACSGIDFTLAREVEREVKGGAIALPSQKDPCRQGGAGGSLGAGAS
jgi:hypothetical protein